MNIYIDVHNSLIAIGRLENKKEPSYYFQKEFSYCLDSLESKIRAIQEFLKCEETKILSSDLNNILIISDETIAFGLFDLPKLSRFKIGDVFETRFKSYYPNFNDYFVDYYEYEKNNSGSIYFYTLTKKHIIDEIINVFAKSSIQIKGFNYFADALVQFFENKNEYPEANLIIGKDSSELIISKGNKVISTNYIDYGLKQLIDSNEYFFSPYFYNNIQARKFAGFVKENISAKEIINDVNIYKNSPETGLKYSNPKELRILKESSLSNYTKKNNARKLYALIWDIIEKYSHEPFFLPIKEIKVKTNLEMFELLSLQSEDKDGLMFIYKDYDFTELVKGNTCTNNLYKKMIKKERKKFDWSKFLTMEIGRKKVG